VWDAATNRVAGDRYVTDLRLRHLSGGRVGCALGEGARGAPGRSYRSRPGWRRARRGTSTVRGASRAPIVAARLAVPGMTIARLRSRFFTFAAATVFTETHMNEGRAALASSPSNPAASANSVSTGPGQ